MDEPIQATGDPHAGGKDSTFLQQYAVVSTVEFIEPKRGFLVDEDDYVENVVFLKSCHLPYKGS